MNHNRGVTGGGGPASTREEEFACFDSFPPELRAALRESLGKWSAYQITLILEQGRMRWLDGQVVPATVERMLQVIASKENEIWDGYRQQTGQHGHDIPLPNTYRDNPSPRSPHRLRRLPRRDRFGRLWAYPGTPQH